MRCLTVSQLVAPVNEYRNFMLGVGPTGDVLAPVAFVLKLTGVH
jgi:hypothetical protein